MKYAVAEKRRKSRFISIVIFIISHYEFLNISTVLAWKTKRPRKLISTI